MKTKLYILPILLLFLTSCFKEGRGYIEEDGKIYYEKWDGGNWRLKKLFVPADTETFEIIESPFGDRVSKDKNHVFIGNRVIKGADPKSYRFPNIKNGGHAIDKNRIYRNGYIPIPGSTSEGFEVLDDRKSYIRDKHRVYWLGNPLEINSIDNFQLLDNGWSTDGHNYFWTFYKNPSIHYNQIKLFKLGVAKDKNKVYYKDKQLLKLLREKGIEIDTIDAESFEEFDLKYEFIFKDNLGCIDLNRGRKDCPDKSE